MRKVSFYIYRKKDDVLMADYRAYTYSRYTKLLKQMESLNEDYYYKVTGLEEQKKSMTYRQKITLKHRMPKFGRSA